MGLRVDPGSFRWCQALSRSRSIQTKINPLFIKQLIHFYLGFILVLNSITNTLANNNQGGGGSQQDAVHITAILGESVIFNCHVEFPGDQPVPYVLQWEKKVSEPGEAIPVYIWYENYPTHSADEYEGRVSRVAPDSPYGAASLNLTNIRESDQGWYECKVAFLNRSPNSDKNGTFFHLDVHAPPHFSVTPENVIYVNLGDSIILNCQADGTPTPELLWYKDANPVDPSSTVGIFNDGTELRISTIRHEDIGEYTCIARNGEGQVSHTARVIIAGGAVIMVPPTNQTKLEGEKATLTCEAKALPGNVTVRWFREGAPVREVASLETRVTIRKDGSLVINPVSAEDTGQYLCEVFNGIGDPQSASAYLNVEYPAKVTFTPTVQYLPFRLAGVVQCYVKANPPQQYVTWTKDKRLLEPYQTKDIVIMNNGSLLFTRVNQNHQGRYTCTPYNAHGTQGSSGSMEVMVRKPPSFTIEPDPIYQRKVGETVEMHCDGQEAEGTQKPNIQWQRRDGTPLQRNRVKVINGNITIEDLRSTDFGYYQCVVSNEVATIVSATQLVIEGTQPHAPYNITATSTEFSVTLSWMPGYSGGPDYKQDYTIWYKEAGATEWSTIPVTPSGSTQVTINRLTPGTTYEFQVVGKNSLGDGMMSKIVTIKTLEPAVAVVNTPAPPKNVKSSTSAPADSSFPLMPDEAGPKPGQPRNLTVTEVPNGFLLQWQGPLDRAHLVQFYTIKYRTDAQWKNLNRAQIRPEETSYLVKNLVGGRTYYFRVLANSLQSYESSDEVKFPVPARVKHKAITAGVVGGILFFIVAIILSICAVKICNKRKRRKQEKAYNMVACRITEARNAASRTGSTSSYQVPSKKCRTSRIPGVNILLAILQFIWPHDRCTNCQTIYSISLKNGDTNDKNLDQIHRSSDGRFILTDDDEIDGIHIEQNQLTRRHSTGSLSQYSSSDDGGFIRKESLRTTWRRPLIISPSQLSEHTVSYQPEYVNSGLLKIIGLHHPHPHHHHHHHHRGDQLNQTQPFNQNLHINTITPPTSIGQQGPLPSSLYTPSRVSRIVSSSPATSLSPSGILMPWSPHTMYFSDLSSVPPGSAERSHHLTPPQGGITNQLRYVQERYSQELPSLRTIHEEAKRMSHGFSPLRIQMDSPAWRSPQPPISTQHIHVSRSKNRHIPRQSRISRSAPELGSPMFPFTMRDVEASPESRSSSSGFGSKNTSTQQNQSSQSGSTHEWRHLPPYRPPPPPNYRVYHPQRSYYPYYPNYSYNYNHDHLDLPSGFKSPTPPHSMNHWLELIQRLNNASEHLRKAVDVGSVDGHYEFDPSTPTPSASTPTGPRDETDHMMGTSMLSMHQQIRKRPSRYENIESRIQAMKEEFHAFRQRQAMRRSHGVELESAC